MTFTILSETKIAPRKIVLDGPRDVLLHSLLVVRNNETRQVFNSVRANWRLAGRWMTDFAINSKAAIDIAEQIRPEYPGNFKEVK